jgi:hypothetical protein
MNSNSSITSGIGSNDSFLTAKAKKSEDKKLKLTKASKNKSISGMSLQSKDEMNMTANFDINSQDKRAYGDSFGEIHGETPGQDLGESLNESIEEKTEIDAEVDLLSESELAVPTVLIETDRDTLDIP